MDQLIKQKDVRAFYVEFDASLTAGRSHFTFDYTLPDGLLGRYIHAIDFKVSGGRTNFTGSGAVNLLLAHFIIDGGVIQRPIGNLLNYPTVFFAEPKRGSTQVRFLCKVVFDAAVTNAETWRGGLTIFYSEKPSLLIPDFFNS